MSKCGQVLLGMGCNFLLNMLFNWQPIKLVEQLYYVTGAKMPATNNLCSGILYPLQFIQAGCISAVKESHLCCQDVSQKACMQLYWPYPQLKQI
jgi:hypothetical protein